MKVCLKNINTVIGYDIDSKSGTGGRVGVGKYGIDRHDSI